MNYQTLDKYLPHKSPMILLDKVVEVTDQYAICESMINHQGVLSPFLTESGDLPSWYFIELMAQTIGVWNGVRLNSIKKLPNIALLLGIRGFTTSVNEANFNDVLHIKADLTLFDDTICSFRCCVMKDQEMIAQANLVVYEAADQNIEQIFDWNKK